VLHEKAVKKVEKALGVKVEQMGHRWGCVYDGQVLSWISSPRWDNKDVLEASNWHIRRIDDHSDSMVDYFAGSHRDNLTQLINAVKPPEPKFPVGSLVQGKENKRAQRQGYANRLAIVTEAGSYMYLKWVSGDDDRYRVAYPERDFQLASAAN
jgi:hypothetical protein